MELPLNVEYRYIAKIINYGMIFVLGFIIFFAWIFIRRRDKRIEVLEEENHELEDEISVLERAKKAHIAKKSPQKEAKKTTTTEVKKPIKKTVVVKPKPTEEIEKSPTKKPTTINVVTEKPRSKTENPSQE